MSENIKQFIDQLAAGEVAEAKDTLENELASRSFEALDEYKKLIAQNIFGGNEEYDLEVQNEEELEEEVEQLDELSPATLHSYRAQASQDATKRLNKDMQLGDAGYALRNLQSKKNTTNPNRSLNAHAGAGAALLKHHPDLHKKISKIYDTMQQRRKKEMEVFHKRREGERRANAKIQKAAEKGEF